MSLGMTIITNDDLQPIIAKWNEGEPLGAIDNALEAIDNDCLIYTNFSGKTHRFTDIVVANALDVTNPVLKQFVTDTDGFYDNCYELSVATLLQAIKTSTDKDTRIKWDDYVDLLENLNPDTMLCVLTD